MNPPAVAPAGSCGIIGPRARYRFVSSLGNAVGFINNDQWDSGFAQDGNELRIRQLLGSGKYEFSFISFYLIDN